MGPINTLFKTSLFLVAVGLFTSANVRAADVPETIEEGENWTARDIILKTWMNYSGPQIINPTKYTTSKNGKTDKALQHMDTLITAGYRVRSGFVTGVGVPVNIVTGEPGFQVRAPFFGILEARLLRSSRLNIVADLRISLPVGDIATTEDFQGGARSQQTVVYDVPGTTLTVGFSTAIRASKFGPNGVTVQGLGLPRRDFEFSLSPFARLPLSNTVSAVVYSGWLQLGHQFGKPAGLTNYPVNIEPGIKWDFSSQASLNPYLSILPSNLGATSIGMVLNTRWL